MNTPQPIMRKEEKEFEADRLRKENEQLTHALRMFPLHYNKKRKPMDTQDIAEILVALEMITEELRAHSNDERGSQMIAESLVIQKRFRTKYHILAPSERQPQ